MGTFETTSTKVRDCCTNQSAVSMWGRWMSFDISLAVFVTNCLIYSNGWLGEKDTRFAGNDVSKMADPALRLQTKACSAEQDSAPSLCACSASCPCRSNGCGPLLAANLCNTGPQQMSASCCTMPGNCRCSKGCTGKLWATSQSPSD